MSENHENRYQLRAAAKAFEWLRRSKPAVAAREQEKMSEGVALPPNERDCGTACSMQGTDRETLNEWCKEHETTGKERRKRLFSCRETTVSLIQENTVEVPKSSESSKVPMQKLSLQKFKRVICSF